jgi:hypothetical protein
MINRIFENDQIENNFPEIFSKIESKNSFFEVFWLWIDKISMKSAIYIYE